jgi:hypothetical protein
MATPVTFDEFRDALNDQDVRLIDLGNHVFVHDVTFDLDDREVIIAGSAAQPAVLAGSADQFLVHGNSTVQLININILVVGGGAIGLEVDDPEATLVLEDCSVSGASNVGIQALGGSTLVVRRSQVFDNLATGIDLDANTFTVENTHIYSNGQDGVVVRRAALGDGLVHVTVAKNNSTGVNCLASTTVRFSLVTDNAGEEVSGACNTDTSLVANHVDGLFGPDGLRLVPGSAAVDAANGSTASLDSDQQRRDLFPDLGADELDIAP